MESHLIPFCSICHLGRINSCGTASKDLYYREFKIKIACFAYLFIESLPWIFSLKVSEITYVSNFPSLFSNDTVLLLKQWRMLPRRQIPHVLTSESTSRLVTSSILYAVQLTPKSHCCGTRCVTAASPIGVCPHLCNPRPSSEETSLSSCTPMGWTNQGALQK